MGFVRLSVSCALCLWLCQFPVIAGDNAVGDILWEKEPTYEVFVKEATCQELGDCCSIDTPCSVAYNRVPDPAPIPLPPSLLLLTAAIAALVKP